MSVCVRFSNNSPQLRASWTPHERTGPMGGLEAGETGRGGRTEGSQAPAALLLQTKNRSQRSFWRTFSSCCSLCSCLSVAPGCLLPLSAPRTLAIISLFSPTQSLAFFCRPPHSIPPPILCSNGFFFCQPPSPPPSLPPFLTLSLSLYLGKSSWQSWQLSKPCISGIMCI